MPMGRSSVMAKPAALPPAPTFRSMVDMWSSNSSDFTIGNGATIIPAGSVSGDFLLAWCDTWAGSTVTLSSANGPAQGSWTEITQLLDASHLRVFWAFGTGALSLINFHATNTNMGGMAVAAFRGVNTTTPIDCTSALTVAGGSNVAIPNITTATDNTLRVCLGWIGNDPVTGPSLTTAQLVTTGGSGFTRYMGYKTAPTHGVVGGETFTHGGASLAIGHLALRPA